MSLENEDHAPAPRTAAEAPPSPRIAALVDSLDCLTQTDLCALAAVKPSTADAWAKRGEGPPYVMFGNRRLYPRAGVRQFLAEKVKTRPGLSAGSLL